tara:strand:- start:1377 stop:4004 length:2628 start_codon:yes stop_codon:yes gene_type:complete
MSIPNVIQLKINLLTNFQDKKITFEKDLLSSSDPEVNNSLNANNLHSYPYICLDHAYPDNIFNNLYYYETVEIIFNENRLVSHITSLGSVKLSKNNIANRNNSISKNILLTLKALFPTSFPVIDDITHSIDRVLKNTASSFFNYDTGSRIVGNLYYGKQFSYLNYDNNFYTFSKLIFINDIMNHPVYFKILKSYNNYFNYVSDIMLSNDNNKYIKILKDINEIVNALILCIFKDLLLELSKSEDKRGKIEEKNFQITNTFIDMLNSIFVIKHIINKIALDYSITADGVMAKLTNILKLPTFNGMHPKLLEKINEIIENYQGVIYYKLTSDDNINNFDYLKEIDVKISDKNEDIIIESTYNNKSPKEQGNYKQVKIDDLYDTTSSDEIKKNLLGVKNAINFLIHFFAFSNQNLFTDNNNIPALSTKLPTKNLPVNKDYKNHIFKLQELGKNLKESTTNLKNKYTISRSDVNNLDNVIRENKMSIKIDSKYTDAWKRYKNQFKMDKTRTTTNDYLQRLIEEENLDIFLKKYSIYSDYLEKCTHISNIFPRIYRKFITKDTNRDPECDILANICSDVGVSIIKQTDNNQIIEFAEIYVISDFIKDKINQENIKDIKCGYIDNKLGYMINDVFYNDRFSDSKYWDLTGFRDRIDTNDTNDTNEDNIKKKQQKYSDNNAVRYTANTNIPNNNQNDSINNQRIKDKFRNFLDENTQIKQKLDEYNSKARTTIDVNDLYDKFKSEFPDIEYLLIKWTDTEYYNTEQKNLNLKQSFIKVKSKINETISLNKNNIKTYEDNKGLFTEDDYNKAKYKFKIFNLFNIIVEELEKNSNTSNNSKETKETMPNSDNNAPRRNPFRNNRAKGGKNTRKKRTKKNKSRKI